MSGDPMGIRGGGGEESGDKWVMVVDSGAKWGLG
jgi:hypothetical protein